VFSILNISNDPEIAARFEEDEFRIKIRVNLRSPKKKGTEEVIIDVKCCHGEAMGIQICSVDDEMLGGDYSLKDKIMENKQNIEKKSIKEKIIDH
jgi:hypothetical protein